ncbi:MAG: phage tail protein [Chloroflexota bacterium]
MTINILRTQTNPAFRFVVDIAGVPQAVFTECTLPVVEWEMEPVHEGGLNTYVHQLPGRQKAATITLKNGVATSALLNWYIDSMNETFKRHTVSIKLLNASDKIQRPIMTWDIENALPVKWTGPQLSTASDSIAIQTLELVCGRVSLTRHAGQQSGASG